MGEGGERFRDVAAHELPDEAEGEGALAVGDVGALDADEGEVALSAQFDGVIGVLHGLEAHELVPLTWFVDVAPVDAAGEDFVVGLQEHGTVAEVVKEGVDGRLDIQRIKPEGEDAGLALAFGVEVFDLGFFFLGDGVEAGVGVEEVGDESEVEFWVAGDEGGWGEEFAAGEAVGVLEDEFGAVVEVVGLEGSTVAEGGGELGEEDGVVVAFFYVGGEVVYAGGWLEGWMEGGRRGEVPFVPLCVLKVVVEPS